MHRTASPTTVTGPRVRNCTVEIFVADGGADVRRGRTFVGSRRRPPRAALHGHRHRRRRRRLRHGDGDRRERQHLRVLAQPPRHRQRRTTAGHDAGARQVHAPRSPTSGAPRDRRRPVDRRPRRRRLRRRRRRRARSSLAAGATRSALLSSLAQRDVDVTVAGHDRQGLDRRGATGSTSSAPGRQQRVPRARPLRPPTARSSVQRQPLVSSAETTIGTEVRSPASPTSPARRSGCALQADGRQPDDAARQGRANGRSSRRPGTLTRPTPRPPAEPPARSALRSYLSGSATNGRSWSRSTSCARRVPVPSTASPRPRRRPRRHARQRPRLAVLGPERRGRPLRLPRLPLDDARRSSTAGAPLSGVGAVTAQATSTPPPSTAPRTTTS